jgi:hypothetical protein
VPDAVIEKIHMLFLTYWPPIYANLMRSMLHLDRPERQEQLFSALSFPFHPLPVPSFELVVNSNLDELIGALATSSAAQTCLASADQLRLVALFEDLVKVWGEPAERKTGVETRPTCHGTCTAPEHDSSTSCQGHDWKRP